MPITIQNTAGGGVTLDSSTTANETVNLPTGGGTLITTAGGTMTGVIAGFESTGIDDNATSTAITIDASENVGIGTSSPKTTLNVIGASAFGTTNANMMEVTGTGVPYFAVAADASNYRSTRINVISSGGYADLSFEKVGTTSRTGLPSAGTPETASPLLYLDASSGNVGIGTSSPDGVLDVEGTIALAGSKAGVIFNSTVTPANNNTGSIGLVSGTINAPASANANSKISGLRVAPTTSGSFNGAAEIAGLKVETFNGQSATIATGLYIDEPTGGDSNYAAILDGNVLIGTTLNATSGGFALYPNNNNSLLRIGHVAGSGSTSYYHQFYYNGSQIGNIWQNGTTGVSYNTSSDYRLKENVTTIVGSVDRVKALKPCRFNFISEPDRTVDGFLAHEAQEVVPEAVGGTKDAMMDEEYEVTAATDTEAAVMGTRSVPDMQGIDQSKLVPLLTATIQELIARIEALENV